MGQGKRLHSLRLRFEMSRGAIPGRTPHEGTLGKAQPRRSRVSSCSLLLGQESGREFESYESPSLIINDQDASTKKEQAVANQMSGRIPAAMQRVDGPYEVRKGRNAQEDGSGIGARCGIEAV